MQDKIFIKTPAKINLFLRILDQKEDGYHNIRTGVTFLDFQVHFQMFRHTFLDIQVHLIKIVNNVCNLPIIACGGAGNFFHLKEVFELFNLITFIIIAIICLTIDNMLENFTYERNNYLILSFINILIIHFFALIINFKKI